MEPEETKPEIVAPAPEVTLKGHSLSECPNCHEKKMPHRACPKCGYYKGREVVDVEEAS